MTTDETRTEAALRSALGAEPATRIEPAPFDVITRRACIRRWRNRVAVATAGLAVVAGVGVTLGPSRTPVPSSVLASVDGETPEPVATPEPAVTPEPTPTPQRTLDSPIHVIPLDPDDDPTSAEPAPHTIVSDGDGSFVGIGVSSATGANPDQLRHSPDGEVWTVLGTLDIGDFYMSDLTVSNGTYVAVLTPTSARDSSAVSRQQRPPDPSYLAVSTDLEQFDLHEMPPVSRGGELFRTHRVAMGVSTRETQTVVDQGVLLDIDRNQLGLTTAEFCGSIDDERGFFALHCDGSLTPILSTQEQQALSLDQRVRRFRLEQDGSFEEIEAATVGFPLVATGVGWVTTDGLNGLVLASQDGQTWSAIASLPADRTWAVVGTDGEHQVLATGGQPVDVEPDNSDTSGGGTDGDNDNAGSLPLVEMALVDAVTGNVTVLPAVPMPDGFSLPFQGVVRGNDGWFALAVPDLASPNLSAQQDGWRLWSQKPGFGNGARFVVVPQEELAYLRAPFEFMDRSSAAIDRGLFGELRFWNPGTDQMLVEVDRHEAREWRLGTLDRTAIEGVLKTDGWSVAGDPLLGPLRITSPDGVERIFDDGFAFTNGDRDDGVELVGEGLEFGDYDLMLRNGDFTLTLPFAGVIDALTVEIPDEPEPQADELPSQLLHLSDDGEWTIVAEVEGLAPDSYPRLVVGADEVLVVVGGQPTDSVRRVPLDGYHS